MKPRRPKRIDPIHQGFDIAIEATGRVEELATACCSLVPEGVCESAGNHFKPGELPLFQMYLNSVKVRIARDNVRANIPPALHNKPVFVREPVRRA